MVNSKSSAFHYIPVKSLMKELYITKGVKLLSSHFQPSYSEGRSRGPQRFQGLPSPRCHTVWARQHSWERTRVSPPNRTVLIPADAEQGGRGTWPTSPGRKPPATLRLPSPPSQGPEPGAELGTRTACPKQLGGREQVLGLEGACAPKVCWCGEKSNSSLPWEDVID